jgi:hypothetical protein
MTLRHTLPDRSSEISGAHPRADQALIKPFLTKCQELWPGAQVMRPYMPSERWSAAMRGFIQQQQKFAHQRESAPADAGNLSDRKG